MEIELEFTLLLFSNIALILLLFFIKYIYDLIIDPSFYELFYILLIILFYIFFYLFIMGSCNNINCNIK